MQENQTETDGPRSGVESEICSSCDGYGSISYNPNLHPNAFPATSSAKCTHCGGTGRIESGSSLDPLVMRTNADETPESLAKQVATLEWKVTKLDSLVGEMLATLYVNLERGRLTTEDDDELKMLLAAWSEQRHSA